MPIRHGARAALATAFGFALFVATRAAAAAETIRPGYWESDTKVTSPIQTSKTERRCVTAKQVAAFTTCYINHHYKCDCPQQAYAGGQIRFHGDCVDAKGRHVQIEGEGSYTPTTLRMSARGHFHLMGLLVAFSASTSSRRIADLCPAQALGSDMPTR